MSQPELESFDPYAPHPDASGPPPEPKRSGWVAVKFTIKAIEIRLRFVAILVGIGLLIGYWDTLRNYWDKWTRPSAASVAAAAAGEEFYCPMHPSVVRDTLDPDGTVPECPICGMPLSKRKKGEAAEMPAGVVGRVQLSPERVQLAGIQTVAAEYRPLLKEVRTIGFVDYDESHLSKIVTRVDGYVEQLLVNKTFETVSQDQPLAEIYSPALYSTAQELLLAHRRGLADLVTSGRERLRLLGISDQEIDAILESGEAGSRLVIRSPQQGHVIAKHIVKGERVTEGMTLFEVADLTSVWIEAEVYEKDVLFLKPGQAIEARVESFPNRVFEGKVSLVHPHLELETRTNRVRFELPNPKHELRPGMYATVSITVPVAEIEPFRSMIAARHVHEGAIDEELIEAQRNCPVTGLELGKMGASLKQMVGAQPVFLCCKACVEKLEASPDEYLAKIAPPPEDAVLSVPQQAVIDTGSLQVAYIEREPGLFEGVKVTLGPRAGEFYPVIDGLLPGDRVAAAGAFLIDAETRLNPAAASTYFGSGGSSHTHDHGQPQRSAPSPQRSSEDRGPPLAAADPGKLSPEHLKEIAKLPVPDQTLARAQALCPITGEPLGSMGMPFKLTVEGKSLFLCCQGCEGKVKKDPKAALQKASAKP